MNTLRRVGLVAVSCIILLLALLCPVSAGSITRQDLLDVGFVEGEDGLLYASTYDPFSFSDFMLISAPNYPDFKPNDIPWKDAPQYVKDILIMDLKDFSNSNFPWDTSEYKVPFVCVRVNGSNAMVYVGVNICVLYISNNDRVCIGKFYGYKPSSIGYQNSYLYRATFDLDTMEMITPWYDASGDCTQWDTYEEGQVFTYTGALSTSTGKYDLYFYGANCVYMNNRNISATTLSHCNDCDDFATVRVNQPLGFQSGKYFFSGEDTYHNTFCSYFVPSIYPEINSGVVGDYDSKEDALINGYNPGDISSDIKIEIDSDAWNAIFSIFNMFVTGNSVVVTLIITMLSLGFLALILNR